MCVFGRPRRNWACKNAGTSCFGDLPTGSLALSHRTPPPHAMQSRTSAVVCASLSGLQETSWTVPPEVAILKQQVKVIARLLHLITPPPFPPGPPRWDPPLSEIHAFLNLASICHLASVCPHFLFSSPIFAFFSPFLSSSWVRQSRYSTVVMFRSCLKVVGRIVETLRLHCKTPLMDSRVIEAISCHTKLHLSSSPSRLHIVMHFPSSYLQAMKCAS